MQTDQDILRKFINIPVIAEKVEYEIEPMGSQSLFGPTDYRLVAVLYYSENDYKKIMSDVASNLVQFTLTQPNWLEEHPSFVRYKEQEKLVFEHTKVVSAEDYYKSPYLNGNVIALDELQALLVQFHTN